MQTPKINVMQCRSTYTTGGGPDKTVLLVGERIDRSRFNMVIMYMRGAGDKDFQIAQWAREKGLTVHEVVERGKMDLDNLLRINTLIRDYRIDIFHARDYKTCIVGYLLSFFNPGMKLVFTAHGWVSDSAKMRLYTWLNLLSLRRYHRLIAVSQSNREIMLKSNVEAAKIEVIYNAIDTEFWRRDTVTSTLRAELGIPATAKIVGVIGRLRYEKDIPTTLAVAAKVIEARPETYFLLVGDGDDREAAERSVVHMGIDGRVLFLGFRRDTINIYGALDLFASTSLTEGTPNTVLEAMAMEVPVVHTAVGGVPEMINDGHDGILCSVGDVSGITTAILSVLDDVATSARLSRNGRVTVCERFSFHSRMKKIEQAYAEVAAMA